MAEVRSGEASAVLGWERRGLSALLPGVEARDFAVAVLEVEDSREGVAEVFQEAVEVTDEQGPPFLLRLIAQFYSQYLLSRVTRFGVRHN
jgi:hypothetical protein